MVLRQYVLLLAGTDRLPFIVVEAVAFVLGYNLGRVVEEDTG